MFFSLELSLSRMAPQSHSRSWSVTSAHVLKRKIKHLMSEMNSQLQQLFFYTYHLTCTRSPHLLSSGCDLTRSRSAQAPHIADFARSNCFTLVVSRRLLVWALRSLGRCPVFAWPSSLLRKRWAATPSTHSLQSSSSHTAHCVVLRMHAQVHLHLWIAWRSRHLFRLPL